MLKKYNSDAIFFAIKYLPYNYKVQRFIAREDKHIRRFSRQKLNILYKRCRSQVVKNTGRFLGSQQLSDMDLCEEKSAMYFNKIRAQFGLFTRCLISSYKLPTRLIRSQGSN